MGLAGTPVALLVYHTAIHKAASWCESQNVSKEQAFVIGAGLSIVLTRADRNVRQ